MRNCLAYRANGALNCAEMSVENKLSVLRIMRLSVEKGKCIFTDNKISVKWEFFNRRIKKCPYRTKTVIYGQMKYP